MTLRMVSSTQEVSLSCWSREFFRRMRLCKTRLLSSWSRYKVYFCFFICHSSLVISLYTKQTHSTNVQVSTCSETTNYIPLSQIQTNPAIPYQPFLAQNSGHYSMSEALPKRTDFRLRLPHFLTILRLKTPGCPIFNHKKPGQVSSNPSKIRQT